MSEDKVYIISNPKEDAIIHEGYVDNIIKELMDRDQIDNRSSNINNCNIINYEGVFVTLLD